MTRIDNTNGLIPTGDGSTNSANNETATVRLGENALYDVAQRLRVDSDSMRKANPGVSDPANLKVGQELCLPKPQTGPATEHGHERGAENEHRFPRRPIGDPLAEGAIKALLAKIGLRGCSGDKPPLDADKISFGQPNKPIDADKISFGQPNQPIDADKISFGQNPGHRVNE